MIGRAEALFYHSELIRRFGGSDGVRDEGILDAALNRPYATFDGTDLFPTAMEKAAAMLHGIITGHPFVDGNKHTGYVLARLILQDGGVAPLASEDGKYDLVILVATGKVQVEGVQAWMRERVRSMK